MCEVYFPAIPESIMAPLIKGFVYNLCVVFNDRMNFETSFSVFVTDGAFKDHHVKERPGSDL